MARRSRLSGRHDRLPVAALVLALATAGVMAPALAQTSITAPTLSAPATVSLDAEGVPLIQGRHDNDVAFLQGWAHARDRFFQMDLTRRSASGTLAELVGASVLQDDVQARTIGLRRAAVRTWNALDADTRGWIKAYADGVNTWLADNDLPPEYGALELSRAQAWDPVDTVVIGKALAFQLSFDLDIEPTLKFAAYQQAGAAAGFDGAALFFGDTHRIAPADGRVSVPGFLGIGAGAGHAAKTGAAATLAQDGDPVGVLLGQAAQGPIRIDQTTLELARGLRDKWQGMPLFERAFDRKESPIGSNLWAVAGEHTASGKALVANDPHLSLGLPSIFIVHHIHSTDPRYPEPMDAVGASLPGAPGIIHGCNQTICWGTTTNSMDVTDVFQEQFLVNNLGLPYASVHNDGSEPVQWLFQSYYVNQIGDGELDSIQRSNAIGYTNGGVTIVLPRRNNGPVVQIDGNQGLSVAYAGWGVTRELESFRRINRAGDLDQFQEALSYFDFGSQNFVYGDTDGNIAYFVTGEAPIRQDLQAGAPAGGVPPWFIRSGSGVHDWAPVDNRQRNQALPYEILPEAELPHVINPAAGYVANANNDPVGYSLDNDALNQARPDGGIWYMDSGGASSYRQGRIDRELQRLIARGNVTLEDMIQLQANHQQLDAELVLPHLLQAWDHGADSGWAPLAELAADARVSEAIERLRAWDYSTPTGLREGFDPGADPATRPIPGVDEIDASVAASIWAQWRSHAVRASIDTTLARVGLGGALPGNADAYTGFKFLLDHFDLLGGRGASGLAFFQVEGAPTAAAGRDYILLKALRDGLDALASDAFAPAFGGSTELSDYRWGKLHRIVFRHPLGGPFNLPGANPYGFTDLGEGLPGVARPGGYEVVDASGHGVRAQGLNGFMFGSGPARRFVGEMGSPINALQIMPGGQSGVLGSPTYASQLRRWLTNNYHQLVISAQDAAAASPTTIQFSP